MPQENGKLTYPVRIIEVNACDIPSSVTLLMLFLERQEKRGWEILDVVLYPTMRESIGGVFTINYLRINVVRRKGTRTETRRYYQNQLEGWKAV